MDETTPRNGLAELDLGTREPLIRKRPRSGPRDRKKKTAPEKQKLPKGSREAERLNGNRSRLPVPVPKNKSLAEIADMDPDDPAFKAHVGKKRHSADIDIETADPEQLFRSDKQQRANARRARARKAETMVVKAVQVLHDEGKGASKSQLRDGIYDEDVAIAEGILSLEDWDDEELIRGYRRSRHGGFGKPPRFIPREVQQQAFRILVSRGDRTMKKAYVASIERLVELAQGARSEKVRLDAIRELMDRVVGKVPDRVHIATEQPWEHMLADSMVPLSDVPPLELEVDEDGTARVLPLAEDVGEVETGSFSSGDA